MPDEIIHPESPTEEAHPAEPDSSKVEESSAAPFNLEPKPVPPAPESKRSQDKEKEKEEASQSPFSVTVGQVYDGPLDLLLDLIRKQNIDIYDIPIARITSQFLEYTHHLKAGRRRRRWRVHLHGLAADPHQVARPFCRAIPPMSPAATSEDPRRELVERLLEHERFKAAAQMLLQKQQIEEATWTNPGMKNFRRDTQEAGADELEPRSGDRRRHCRSRPRLSGHPQPPPRTPRARCG